MLDIFNSIITWGYWDAILSCLIIIHLVSEYAHYGWEYITGRREAKILEDIHTFRKNSTKSEKIKKLQEDINLIKKRLLIEE